MSWNESVDLTCEVYEVRLIFCSQPNNSRKTQPLRKGYIIQVCTTCVLLHYLHSFTTSQLFVNFAPDFYNYLSAVSLIERNKRTSTSSSLRSILLSKYFNLMKMPFWQKIKKQTISVLSINTYKYPCIFKIKNKLDL